MKIALLAKKGGVGKSTVSLLLWMALRQAGRDAVLLDWDAQGTSTKALELLGGQNAKQGSPTLYDTPPNLEHAATGTAVRSADLCLIVTTPSLADIWEAADAVQFVESRNPGSARVVFNKVRKGTVLGKLLDESARLIPAPALGVNLSERECYKHAIAQGWKSLDGSAREEALELALAVLSLGSLKQK
ncbi:ParA family protein [Bryobacter aggregatus]|uniref:ParA family protein n=1 Tax=Bryobacter aggregatus TaxID=360054 RepID=UPI0004E18954|nr:ParA family protein [Bryobacter aggregatus]